MRRTIKRGVPGFHDGILPGVGIDRDFIVRYIRREQHQAVVNAFSPAAAVPVRLSLAGGDCDLTPFKCELSAVPPDRRVTLGRSKGCPIVKEIDDLPHSVFEGSSIISRRRFDGT